MAFDRAIAAMTAYCEASGGSALERRAIIHTMFNRAMDGRWPKTVAGVCLQRFQFSEWLPDVANNRNLQRAATAPDSDPTMQDCANAYDEIVAGAYDITNGATHFVERSLKPFWTEGANLVLQTPNFNFYANVR